MNHDKSLFFLKEKLVLYPNKLCNKYKRTESKNDAAELDYKQMTFLR